MSKTFLSTIYTRDGWLDIPAIRSLGCWLNVIIGARQVGKTYGVSLDLIQRGNPFVFMRLTSDELAAICGDPALDPWLKLEKSGIHVRMEKIPGAKTYGIYSGEPGVDDKGEPNFQKHQRLGLAMSLSHIARVRGFSGDQYTDLMFDEVIPEEYVTVRSSMGAAAVNAYITINGNRELEGRPPLTAWFLANSNRIDSPILSEFNLLDDLDELMDTGKEWKVTDNGVFLAMPTSEQVMDKRKETALLKQLSKSSEVYRMAVNNEFAWDSRDRVRKHTLNGWQPLVVIGTLTVWTTVDWNHFYITGRPKRGVPAYSTAKDDIEGFRRDYQALFVLNYQGAVTFDSTDTMLKFRKLFKLS